MSLFDETTQMQALEPRTAAKDYDYVVDFAARNGSHVDLENVEFASHCLENLWDSPNFNEWKLATLNGNSAPYKLPPVFSSETLVTKEDTNHAQLMELGQVWRSIMTRHYYTITDRYNAFKNILSEQKEKIVTFFGETKSSIGIPELAGALTPNDLSYTATNCLQRSLAFPPATYQETSLKRDAIVELELNGITNRWITEITEAWKKVEDSLLLVSRSSEGDKEITALQENTKQLNQLVSSAPKFESSLLNDTVNDIRDILNSKFGKMLQEDFLSVWSKGDKYTLIPKKEGSLLQRIFSFDSSSTFFKPFVRNTAYAAMMGTAMGVFAALITTEAATTLGIMMGTISFAIFEGFLYVTNVQAKFSIEKKLSKTFSKLLYQTPNGINLLEKTGRLGELLIFSSLKERFSAIKGGCYPELYDTEDHHFEAVEAHNPITVLNKKVSIPNDFCIHSKETIAQTGANSGGKTYSGKTVPLIHALAQNGCRIPAQAGRLSLVKSIGYQEVQNGRVSEEEGRFGQELKRLADFTYSFDGPSLVILDEVGQGTSINEGRRVTHNVLFYLRQRGCSIILNTHDFELVKELVEEGSCIPLMVEIKDGKPTYKLVPGIAEKSHAHSIEKKHLMDAGALAKKLAEHGINIDVSEFPGEKRYS